MILLHCPSRIHHRHIEQIYLPPIRYDNRALFLKLDFCASPCESTAKTVGTLPNHAGAHYSQSRSENEEVSLHWNCPVCEPGLPRGTPNNDGS
jgi:hypothetical protein